MLQNIQKLWQVIKKPLDYIGFKTITRSSLRKIYAHQLEGYKTCFDDFNESVTNLRTDFERVLELPLDDLERQMLI